MNIYIPFIEVVTEYTFLQWTYECIACFFVSLVATAVSNGFCYSTSILSAPVTLLPGYTISISVVEIMTKNTLAGCARLCYTAVYLCCMVLGLTLAPIIFNAPGNASGVGFQRFSVNINATCDTTRGIAVNKLWLILCVPIYICAYNVYLKVSYSSSTHTGSISNAFPIIDTASAMAGDGHRRQSWLRCRVRLKT